MLTMVSLKKGRSNEALLFSPFYDKMLTYYENKALLN